MGFLGVPLLFVGPSSFVRGFEYSPTNGGTPRKPIKRLSQSIEKDLTIKIKELPKRDVPPTKSSKESTLKISEKRGRLPTSAFDRSLVEGSMSSSTGNKLEKSKSEANDRIAEPFRRPSKQELNLIPVSPASQVKSEPIEKKENELKSKKTAKYALEAAIDSGPVGKNSSKKFKFAKESLKSPELPGRRASKQETNETGKSLSLISDQTFPKNASIVKSAGNRQGSPGGWRTVRPSTGLVENSPRKRISTKPTVENSAHSLSGKVSRRAFQSESTEESPATARSRNERSQSK